MEKIRENAQNRTDKTDKSPLAATSVSSVSAQSGHFQKKNEAPPIHGMTAHEEASIRAWLAYIEETDPAIVAEVLTRCRRMPDARAYFLRRAKEVPQTEPDHAVTCGACRHFQRTEHPHLGHCVRGEPEAAAGLWDSDRRMCRVFEPVDRDENRHSGRQDHPKPA
ncbi:hypothetical protein [Acidihalobacter ferrooxydans]|uniref:hypothetical protein n=1 Tax=Acidihalobacter ferrooxydans TaxID=1765967 RepID=UPI0012EC3FCE|nr:hypothetical protein [Acidihalobacter ferrooxydans]